MELFGAPEGEKLFLLTKAKRALQKARIFMTNDEMEAINKSTDVFNEKVDALYEEAAAKGWKPNTKDGVLQEIEDQAALYIEENVHGYKEAIIKLDSLFGSFLDE